MIPTTREEVLTVDDNGEPRLTRSYTLRFVGDWGGANAHVIFSWLTQAFCDHAGPRSRSAIYSLRDGGIDGVLQVENGEADVVFATPVGIMNHLVKGTGIHPHKLPRLRALGVLPQNDRMVLAIDPKYQIHSIDELRKQRPPITLATSTNDGTNFIGYVADHYLEAHGLSEATLNSWGAKIVRATRPEQCVDLVKSGQADALLQEAIMTPWWRGLIDSRALVPVAAEPAALETLHRRVGLATNVLPAGFWDSLSEDLPAIDFSDFVLLIRDDVPDEVAYVLAWCLVETRHLLEARYSHLAPARSPLTYPLVPTKMCQTPVPLHNGAYEYYAKAGLL